MSPSRAPVRRVAVVAVTGLALAGCGTVGTATQAGSGTTTHPTAGTARLTGDWLLRFTTAGGEDGEREGSAFVRFDPSSGSAVVRRLPALPAADASGDEQALLVSADHAWAIPDTGVPHDQSGTGKLVLYSLTDESTRTLDVRAATGAPGLKAVAWAFDPADAQLLRVVDAEHRIWRVHLDTGTAEQEGTLPTRSGWIFGNGFDKTTGEPYIESIDSDRTEPAGNGDNDTRPLERQAGTVLHYDGDSLQGLPKPPCGLAGVFRFDDGDAWVFCADTPSIAAYELADDAKSWVATGTPSAKVLPADVVDLGFALPPVS